MRRCPKCNRSYQTDTQKFCTHDGGLLFDIDPGLSETVQFDSNKIRDAVAKPTTRDLDAALPSKFDPEATVITSGGLGEETVISSGRDDATVQTVARDTGDLSPQVTQYQITQPPAAAAPVTPPPQTSAPLPPPMPPGPIPPPGGTSGPIPSAPLPPPGAPSGPIGTSAPLAPQPAAAPAPGQPMAAPPKKKSKLPLILGILAVLLVLGVGAIVAAYFVVVKPMLAKRAGERIITSAPAPGNPGLPPTTESPAEPAKPVENEPPPYSPPADAVQFVNSKDNLSGKLADNYVNFSFYYPNRWVKLSSTDNFIKVERRLPPDFTQENFAAAPWLSTDATTTPDNAFFHKLAEKDDLDFAKKFPEYRKISEGPTKVGTYEGYEFRFEAVSRGTDKGDVTLWGREIFFAPRPGEKSGLKFLILTTSLAPELKSAEDVGEKGELPMLLESFRFGKK